MSLGKFPLMIAKLRLVFTITMLFACFCGYSQDNYWEQLNHADRHSKDFLRESHISKGKVFSVRESMLKTQLRNLSFSLKNTTKVYFPDENGRFIAFHISESPVLAPGLSAKYPGIKSYAGYGVVDSEKKIRFSVSQKGMQVTMINLNKATTTFIQKTSKNNYVAYSREGLSKRESDFVCETKSAIYKDMEGLALRPVDDKVLRKYRLAVSTTGEYTQVHGGTVEGALAAINATITRINQIFETDLGVTLELVANNDEVIFINPDTDPYSQGSALTGEVQNTLTQRIGEANYDIGHLFHRAANGGNAGFIGRVCVDGQKGSAYSSSTNPEGDLFDLDFVAHEIGHQLGANHTWSFESEGTGVQAEPGSGSTIMGYAGITQENDVTGNSDDYFHYVSIVQIIENLESKSCGEIVSIANNPPVVSPVPDFIIPALTAFKLTGSATDPDVDDQLTYTWEQIDDGVVVQGSFGPTNPGGANFRSLKPTVDPSRYFPSLDRVISGNLTQTLPAENSAWETVSSIDRIMNFALTVRDNAEGGGQVVSELVEVSVISSGGAFGVTSQPPGTEYIAGELQEVSWEVANTDQAPINTQSVDILLSIDGGMTFPITLAEDVANNGSHQVLLPGLATDNARIMVKANGNIFFAVNEADFTIVESAIVLNLTQTDYEVCQPETVTIPFVYETYAGFMEEVTFSLQGLPSGATVSFSPATATANDTNVELTITDTANAVEGEYAITIQATSVSETKELSLQLLVLSSNFSEVGLISPADGTVDISARHNFEWEASPLYTSYDIQIATDVGFTNIIESATISGNSYTPLSLDNETTYFWRLKPKNICGEGNFGTAFSFTTIQQSCANRMGTNLPIAISPSGTSTISSKITLYDDLILTDLNINIELDHTYLSDLIITITSPSGKEIPLISRSCGELDNINVTFDDAAESFICGGNPAISGTVRPLVGFNSLLGESIAGEWTLTISDTENEDGGSLRSFSMDLCVEGEFSPDEDADGVFDDDDLCPGTPSGSEVNETGCAIYRFASDNFVLKTTSESCRTENDGVLEITTSTILDYSLSIVGNGVNVNGDFTNTYTQNNLAAGTYTVCIDAVDGDKDYEEVCFEVVVTEPEALSVSSRTGMDETTVVLSLSGSTIYTIELNGVLTQTTSPEITIDLKKGNNILKVSGELSCQGSYEEQFFLSAGITVYPNPTVSTVKIFIEDDGDVDMTVYSLDGRLVFSEKRNVQGNNTELDVSNLSAGVYLLKIAGKTQKGTYKIIKQ